jgi:hypothetical protein
MSIWQLGSLGGLRHGCFRENDLTQSRKAAKIITQRIRRSGTRTRLISPSWNIAMNETLCFNIRHPATASPDSTGTRLAVGQAFQPDTSGCQAGKPDLLQTPLSSHMPGHCFFAYFLLCGFAAWREILWFLLQMTSKRPGLVGGRASRSAVRRDCPASGLVPTDRVKGWTVRLASWLEAESCRSAQYQGQDASPEPG